MLSPAIVHLCRLPDGKQQVAPDKFIETEPVAEDKWTSWGVLKQANLWCFIIIFAQGLGTALYAQQASFVVLFVAATLFGFAYGGQITLYATLPAALFGRRNVGVVLGITEPVINVMAIFARPLAAWIFDRTGSYSTAFYLFLVLYSIALTVSWFIKIPESKTVT